MCRAAFGLENGSFLIDRSSFQLSVIIVSAMCPIAIYPIIFAQAHTCYWRHEDVALGILSAAQKYESEEIVVGTGPNRSPVPA